MTEYFKGLKVRELQEDSYISYILSEQTQLNEVGYKVMQSANTSGIGLMECARFLYNGQTKLVYNTNNRQNLEDIISASSVDDVKRVVAKVVAGIIKIKNNGFLGCENIDYAINRIYFSNSTNEPIFIYLPLSGYGASNAYMQFEHDFRLKLIDGLLSLSSSMDEKKRSVVELLTSSSDSLEELHKKLVQDSKGMSTPGRGYGGTKERTLRLYDEGNSLFATVTGTSFSIGRSSDNDKVIKISTSISRHHCQITKAGEKYYILDLGSKYGTFLNGVKCKKSARYEIRNGDNIRLSTYGFMVRI